MPEPFVFSTPQQLRHADPMVVHPPIISNDGDVHAIAHGNRELPIVGRIRTPYIDISLDELNNDHYLAPLRNNGAEHLRIYADDFEDAFAAWAGEECQRAVMVLAEAEITDDPDIAETSLADYTLLRYRSRFAVAAAAIAQRRINDQAKMPPEAAEAGNYGGLWEALTEEERQALETNAANPFDSSGTLVGQVPQGVVIDWDFSAERIADNSHGDMIGKRGSWSAPVPLVVCEHDYWPIGDSMPLRETHRTELDGRAVEVATRGITIKTIRVTNSQDFFEDLAELGLITLDVRPPMDFDPIMRDIARATFLPKTIQE